MTRWSAVPDPPKPPRLWTFLSAALAVPLIFAVLALWLGVEDRRSEELRRDLQRSFASNMQMVQTLALLADAETSQRGYLLTGDPAFLDLYAPAKRDVLAKTVDLRARFDGDPSQQRRLATFEALAKAKFTEMDEALAVRRAAGLARTAGRVSEGRGKRLMDSARAVAGEIIAVENAATARRRASFESGTANNRRIAWGIVIAAAVVIAIAMGIAWRQRRERFAAAEAGYIAAQRQRVIFDSTVDAIAILKLNRAAQTGEGRRPAWPARPRTLAEVHESILTKLSAIARKRGLI